MRKRIGVKHLNIALISLSLISCSISGFARLISNLIISTAWIEGIVGLGMGGFLFFFGIFGLIWGKIGPDIGRRVFALLIGTASLILGLIVLFIALKQIAS